MGKLHENMTKFFCESLAITASLDAVDAGGEDPFNVDGECMLPRGPMEGDWEWFESYFKSNFKREANEQEKGIFYNRYCEEMEYAIDDLYDKNDDSF